MTIKTVFTLLLFTIIQFEILSQNIKIEFKNNEIPDIEEVYYVLDTNKTIKDGPYTQSIKGKIATTGSYSKGAKNGVWRYYDLTDDIELEINYDNGELKYRYIDSLTKEKKYKHSLIIPLDDRPAINLISKKTYVKYLLTNFKYPAYSEKRRETGDVFISVHISSEGKIKNYSISSSSGYKNLDNEALRVLQLIPMDFLPEYKNGEPIESEMKFKIRFKLDN